MSTKSGFVHHLLRRDVTAARIYLDRIEPLRAPLSPSMCNNPSVAQAFLRLRQLGDGSEQARMVGRPCPETLSAQVRAAVPGVPLRPDGCRLSAPRLLEVIETHRHGDSRDGNIDALGATLRRG